MGIENQEYREETNLKIDLEKEREIRIKHIHDEMKDRGLSPHHARNLLSKVSTGLYLQGIHNLERAQRYEERVHSEEYGNLYMELCDPNAVLEFNNVIDSFNKDVERIKKEKDLDAGQNFINQAVKILERYNA